jgi:uncharacterized MAPEG superfamily protein
MTPELTALTLAALLQLVQFAFYSVAANRQIGTDRALGSRDAPIQLTGSAGRLQRALNNHFEGLILFTIATVVTEISGQNSAFTAACAYTYLAARVAYVPAYYFGLVPWRSVVWFIGFVATTLILIAALV